MVEVIVPPPRVIITPSSTTTSTTALSNSPSVTPITIEQLDKAELSNAAIVGITLGSIFVVLCLAVLLIYGVKIW